MWRQNALQLNSILWNRYEKTDIQTYYRPSLNTHKIMYIKQNDNALKGRKTIPMNVKRVGKGTLNPFTHAQLVPCRRYKHRKVFKLHVQTNSTTSTSINITITF